jgi:hypothetical protein
MTTVGAFAGFTSAANCAICSSNYHNTFQCMLSPNKTKRQLIYPRSLCRLCLQSTKFHVNWRTCSPFFLVLSHMFGYVEQKLLGRSRKSLVFLKSNFSGSEKFQVSAHILPK